MNTQLTIKRTFYLFEALCQQGAKMTNTEKVCEFIAAIRGYHYYRQFWNPQVSEVLQCAHDFGNVFDIFAIKMLNNNGEIVGHLPREISRVSKFLMDRGAAVQATLTTTNYRRSPLVQGGLEIACKVTVRMAGTVRNHMLLERYMQLVTELYTEPEEEVVLGSFLVRSCETVDQSRVKKRQKVKIQLQTPGDRDEIVIREQCFRVLLPK